MESPAVYLEPMGPVNRLKQRHARYRSSIAVVALLVLTELVYTRPGILPGSSVLTGADYEDLHIRRITFARNALFGIRHTLPGWYPHEVLGSPFAANLQSFPWIPTRLLLLLLDPAVAYGAGIAIAAGLSAIFTYLFCRRAGLSRIGAVAAGWTFACAGYFASRVMAGHLPLLEAYPALPLLLWLVDRAGAPDRAQRHRFDLGILATSSTCVVVAGHPQVPAYAIGAALLYTVWRGRGWLQARVAGVIALGAGLSMAVWWPMLLLIGRSTRVLRLAPPQNDVVMPYRRLMALIMPGIDGWADPVKLAEKSPFSGYPNNSYFWDTTSYVGILPLIAIVALLIGCVVRKQLPGWRWRFLSCLGMGAFLCSLPLATPLLRLLPGTVLRSPARLLYLSTFCAAVALGAGVDAFRRANWPRSAAVRNGLLIAGLSLHFVDLGGFARLFVQVTPRMEEIPEFQAILDREVGDGRIAEGWDLTFSYDDRYDDAGGFDSIFLARFERGLLALEGAPPDLNRQVIDASLLPVKALEALGVRFVVTAKTRTDLELAGRTADAKLYRVARPAPRAVFFGEAQIQYVEDQQIAKLFAAAPQNILLLAPEARKYLPPAGSRAAGDSAARNVNVDYSRPSSDEMVLRTSSDQPGFVSVLEAFDPGWTASVDGADAPVVPANGFAMAIPVETGSHTVRLRYQTRGRAIGAGFSLLSLVLTVVLIGWARPRKKPLQD